MQFTFTDKFRGKRFWPDASKMSNYSSANCALYCHYNYMFSFAEKTSALKSFLYFPHTTFAHLPTANVMWQNRHTSGTVKVKHHVFIPIVWWHSSRLIYWYIFIFSFISELKKKKEPHIIIPCAGPGKCFCLPVNKIINNCSSRAHYQTSGK